MWSGDCEREGFTLSCLEPWLALNLIRSHHHRKGFFAGGCFDLFYGFHISSALKGHLRASYLSPEPPGLTQPMSCAFVTPKNHNHLKPKAALWEGPDDLRYPKAQAGGSRACACGHEWGGGSQCHVVAPVTSSSSSAHEPVEEGGGEEWNCSGAMCTPAYSVSEMGVVTLSGITCWAVAYVLCSVSNKSLLYVLGTMQRTELVIANTALQTAFYSLTCLLCLNKCTKEESITCRFYRSKGCFLSAPSNHDLGEPWSIAPLAGRLGRVTEGLAIIFSFNFSLILWSVSSIEIFRS